MNRNGIIRERLWAKDPHCHYCGVLTVRPAEVPLQQRGPKRTPNMATLEHVMSRLNPLRRMDTPGITRYRLACAECNCRRGHVEVMETLSLDEQRQRSGRFPLSQRAMLAILLCSLIWHPDRVLSPECTIESELSYCWDAA